MKYKFDIYSNHKNCSGESITTKTVIKPKESRERERSRKIDKLLTLKNEMNFEIYWDGACSADKILEFAPKGVNGFVLGTTLLFGQETSYIETLKNIRELKFK